MSKSISVIKELNNKGIYSELTIVGSKPPKI